MEISDYFSLQNYREKKKIGRFEILYLKNAENEIRRQTYF